LKRDKGA